MRRITALATTLATVLTIQPAAAQFMDILTAPKTLIERAAEARSVGDIARDNAIVVKVNTAMANQGTINAATEIYEQRLLVTGSFDDKRKYDAFTSEVKLIQGIKALYWHVTYLSESDPKRKGMPSWTDTLALTTKAQLRLTKAVSGRYVNFRITSDSFGTLYVIGRAYTQDEANTVTAALKSGDGVRKVVSYINVRP